MTLFTSLTGIINILTFSFCLHPIHVSVTEIEFDQKEAALEIIMRVFIDDLEQSLRDALHQPELDILNPSAGVTTDELVKNYLGEHFKISLDNKRQKTNYLGHERESEAFIFYIEVKPVKQWTSISIYNDVIMATHDDQSNLVHVYVGEKVKSLRLTRDTPADTLTF